MTQLRTRSRTRSRAVVPSRSRSTFGTLAALLLLFALPFGAVRAQGSPGFAPQQGAGPLVGTWRTSIPNAGGPPVDGVLRVAPDGRYREEMIVQGQLAAFWEGTLTVAPDGTVTQRETSKSPQICAQGQCYPNEGPSTTVSRIVAATPSGFMVSYQDPSSGQSVTIDWRRAEAAPGAAPGSAPGASASSAPGAQTTGPVSPPAANPLDPAPAAPWSGSWSDGDVTVTLGGPQGDVLERGGARYPLQLQGDAQRLRGTFRSDGDEFPLALERTPDGLVLTSGGARFVLTPLGGAGGASNPLGN